MSDLPHRPTVHDHEDFVEQASRRPGFKEAYEALHDEFALVRLLLEARKSAHLTQEEVAQAMGTTKSAISRLESGGKHSPSVSTLRKYARAVGCQVEIRLVREPGPSPAANSALETLRRQTRPR